MKQLTKLLFILFLVFALHITLYTLHSYAAVPHLINYQGRLTDTAGIPLNGTYNLTFRIYDAETAGNLLWQGTYSVSIQKGIFAVLLGDINDAGYNFANLSFDKAYFLEIKVGAEVMTPRQRIASVGYAIRAENVDALPRGIITMWSGKIADIPLGWGLCDGTNGTPDLRDKFVVGARQDVSGIAKTNLTSSFTQSGGSTTITEANLPSHTHNAGTLVTSSAGEHKHQLYVSPGSNFARIGLDSGSSTSSTYNDDCLTSSGAHTHTISGSTGITGSGTIYAQPYYALAFIMKL